MPQNIYDITDRDKDYGEIVKLVSWLESGIRAISIMYDEHSSDVNSKENIFRLKDNIHYRLLSALHMYRLLLEELNRSEKWYEQKETESLGRTNFIGSNPVLEFLEMEISAVFDSVIFNIVSVFDYLSHIICYICLTNKQKTNYWTTLSKSARDKTTEIGKTYVMASIDKSDREFVGKLYDYRSSLIHHKRVKHDYEIARDSNEGNCRIRILMTSFEMKYFKKMAMEKKEENKFTLTYLSSWLIRITANYIEKILTDLEFDIKSKSAYDDNIRDIHNKGKLVIISVDPKTNIGSPASDRIWLQFKKERPLIFYEFSKEQPNINLK